MTDPIIKAKYVDSIETEVQKLQENQADFYNVVNKHVATVFENAYLEKLSKIFISSKSA
jgi:hypothetical protein